MAKILNPRKKLCRVATNGPIPELGGIAGPVKGPTLIPLRTVVSMVQNGRVVYEINPKNYKEEVRLTIRNVNQNNFPDKQSVLYPNEKKTVQASNNIKVDKKEMKSAIQENVPSSNDVKKHDAIDKAMEEYNKHVSETVKEETVENKVDNSEKFQNYKDKREKNRVREDNDFTRK